MAWQSAIPIYRLGFGLLTVVAITTQLVSLAGSGTFDPVNYFTYFTILSNLIATALLLIGAARWRSPRSPTLDLLRGGAVVYMSVTGVVFAALLRGTNVDTAIPWVNSVVHELLPLVVLVDWMLDPPEQRLTYRQGALWLIFPAAWFVVESIRGAVSGKYHYPFTNPANGGYGTVALTSLVVLVFMLAVCAVVVWLGNARSSGAPASVTSATSGAADG